MEYLENERRFRDFINQFPYPAVIFNLQGDSIGANSAWEKLWMDDARELVRYNIKEDPILAKAGLTKQINDAFEGTVSETFPLFYDPSSNGFKGRKRWIQLIFYPLKTNLGEMEMLIVFMKDLTSLKKAEQEVKEMNEALERRVEERTIQLEQANRDLEAFAYTISHDLRTPLRAIESFSSIVIEDYEKELKDDLLQIMKRIQQTSNRMGLLIQDLLKLAMQGQGAVNLKEINIGEVVNHLIEEYKVQYGDVIHFKVGDLPTCFADSTLITQVFQNLIGNAIKYSKPGNHPIIEIGTEIKNDERIFFIKDNGVGFSSRNKEKIFDAFYRLPVENTTEGSGIGLSLVKSIISKHNGKVWAESTEGKGSTFYFTLHSGPND